MKTISTFLLLALFLFANNILLAQEQEGSEEKITGRQFYAEFGGPGVISSVNFDSRFIKGATLGFGYRVGLGFGITEWYTYYYDDYGRYDSDRHTKAYATFPLGLNYVFGKKTSPHTFEIGAGLTVFTRKVDVFNYDFYNDCDCMEDHAGYFIGYFSLMYRRQPLNGGFTWRIGFTPVIGTSGETVFPLVAVGIGYAF